MSGEWLRLDAGFTEHPKVIGLSDKAFRVHIKAMCYAMRYDTAGYLRPAVVNDLATPRVRAELIDAGVWDAENGGAILIHHWQEYQPDVAERRRRAAERKRRQRRRNAGDE